MKMKYRGFIIEFDKVIGLYTVVINRDEIVASTLDEAKEIIDSVSSEL